MFGGAAALGSVTTPLLAAPLVTPPSRQRSEKSLFLFNTNTKESENLIYWANGRYIQSTLDKFNILMRDRRTDEVAIIDPKLYDLMWSLRVALKATGPLQIICGYRSSDSNSSMPARISERDRSVMKPTRPTLTPITNGRDSKAANYSSPSLVPALALWQLRPRPALDSISRERWPRCQSATCLRSTFFSGSTRAKRCRGWWATHAKCWRTPTSTWWSS